MWTRKKLSKLAIIGYINESVRRGRVGVETGRTPTGGAMGGGIVVVVVVGGGGGKAP